MLLEPSDALFFDNIDWEGAGNLTMMGVFLRDLRANVKVGF